MSARVKKFTLFVSITFLLCNFSSIELASAATPKTGSVCTKANATLKIGPVLHTCTREGKKLLWRVANPKAAASNAVVPAPTATTAATPVRKIEKVNFFTNIIPSPSNPVTFANVASRVSDAGLIAWNSAQDALVANKSVLLAEQKFIFKNSPSTTVDIALYQNAVAKARLFYANFLQPKTYLGLYYSAKEFSWARSAMQESIPGIGEDVGVVTAPFHNDPSENCGGANSGEFRFTEIGFTVFGACPGHPEDVYTNGSALIIHEYTHSLQNAQFMPIANFDGKDPAKHFPTIDGLGSPGYFSNNSTPCWLTEGGAHWTGLALGNNSFTDFVKMRNSMAHMLGYQSATGNGKSQVLKKEEITPEFLVDYYDQSVPGENACIRLGTYGLGYSLGMITVEALSAIGGAESTVALYQHMGVGEDFPTAFKSVYGVAWTEAKVPLSKYVAAQLQSIL